jgi:hypothetical protein
MSILQLMALPPGFEGLSKEEQMDYVQQLWDWVVDGPEAVPVIDWHLEIVQERMASPAPEPLRDWGDVKQRLLDTKIWWQN